MSKEKLGSLQLNRIYQMDCLEGLKLIPDVSVDMILCDLPYGTTNRNSWDSVIPFEPLWEQYERIIKDKGAIILFGSQPFTSKLVMSNEKLFKYEIVWDKVNIGNPLNAKKMPLKSHENILVFYKKQPTYNPQMTDLEVEREWKQYSTSLNFGELRKGSTGSTKGKYPKSIWRFSNASRKDKMHPTQKPVLLFEYLIRTYSNEDEVILDNCMGSGTTAIAALNTKRKFIGFETESKYIEIANKRLESAYDKLENQKLLGEE